MVRSMHLTENYHHRSLVLMILVTLCSSGAVAVYFVHRIDYVLDLEGIQLTDNIYSDLLHLQIQFLIGIISLMSLVIVFLIFNRRYATYISYEAKMDALTGTLSRKIFFQMCGRLLEELYPQGGTAGYFLMLDLDWFKEVNDRYGHPAGDQVLREMTRHLRELFGSNGLVGRMGGDEFAVLIYMPVTREELEAGVAYCHLRGVKVYLTLNTLLTNRELPLAAETGAWASDLGIDAVLVQDLGVARLLRRTCPDLPLHASTQMTVHSLDGVRACADLGMTRVVLSRELSADAIADLCARSPVELEVFGHGALCMCYSGQCFLSAVLGGRSGNRGLCAQPCRLKYGWEGRADGYPLSLKDMSLAGHLQELRKLGVKCVKLEGRMKRPEYVSIVTGIYARAIHEDREPTAEELRQLEAAFSRQGFTDGYYLDQKGPDRKSVV